MKCINSQSQLSPLPSHHKYKHQFCESKPSSMRLNPNGFSFVSLRTRSLPPSPIFLAATSPAAAGNLSVLLQTSAVCLFAYFVANFVVPELILKDLRSKEANKDGENPAEDER
ncbi:uncharacterized protein LOC105174880 [Sesamum indicum]|uniref:Uncharacterized protein LOC105174880 n=1 Tax=Sesamum indicum TaxID=4182 RepID=A0A6I9U4E6_SESIN|nr:uncharacterized protein LOC105174880 [Sesamum indicum]